MSLRKPFIPIRINIKGVMVATSKDNVNFWKEVWKKYPETEIVYSTEKGKIRENFYANLLPSKEGLLLDLGCGDGKMRPYIKHFVGLDVSGEALSKIEGDVVIGTAEALPFRDECFNHVLMCEVFEHIVDRAKCLREVKRILSIKGELIMSCPYGLHPSRVSWYESLRAYGLPQFYYRDGRFDEKYLNTVLTNFGFRVKYLNVFSVKDIPNNIIVIGEVEK